MTEITELFKGLRITNYYKYLLYLAGIVFILSLFVEVKGIDQSVIRHSSFVVVVTSLAIWIWDNLMARINELVYEWHIHSSGSRADYLTASGFMMGLSYFVQIMVWIFVLSKLV